MGAFDHLIPKAGQVGAGAFPRVSADEQLEADRHRLRLVMDELQKDPDNPALRTEVANTMKQIGGAGPAPPYPPEDPRVTEFGRGDTAQDEPAPATPGANPFAHLIPTDSREPPKGLKIGRERFKEDLRETLQQAGWLNRNIAAAGTALSNPALRLAQVAGGGLSQGGQDLVEANRVMAEEGPAGAIAGNIGLFAVPGGAAARGATTLAGRVLPQATGLAARGARALAAPAAVGAGLATTTTPTLPGESELGVAGMGALGGVGGDVAARVAGRVVRPVVQSPAVQEMLSKGIVPTIGQASGPRSLVNSIEQKLTSLPLIGYFIKGGRERATAEYNLDRIRASVPPAERDRITEVGRQAVEKAQGIVDDAYDAIYSRVTKPVGIDTEWDKAIKDIPNRTKVNLTDDQVKQYDRAINNIVGSRLSEGRKVDANLLREIHNDLGDQSRSYFRSVLEQERRLGRAFDQAKKELRNMVGRQQPGSDFKAAMDKLDDINANLHVARKASGGAKEGIFSAERYAAAAKRRPQEMQAQRAADVLGSTEPDSGTAGRALMALGAGNLGSMLRPDLLTMAAASPLLYSRIGQRYMLGDLIPGQAALGAGLRSTAPYATVAGETIIPKR